MMNPKEIETAERYELGLARVSDAVYRLNNLGHELGLNFALAIRCSAEPARIGGEWVASRIVNEKLQAHHIEAMQLMERRAA